jgi:hypothetical protein
MFEGGIEPERYRQTFPPVIPAQAGIHTELARSTDLWIPACAGMTWKLAVRSQT